MYSQRPIRVKPSFQANGDLRMVYIATPHISQNDDAIAITNRKSCIPADSGSRDLSERVDYGYAELSMNR